MKIILKGILLYSTVIITLLWLSGADSLLSTNLLIGSTLIVAALIIACYLLISKEELKVLTFDKYLKD